MSRFDFGFSVGEGKSEQSDRFPRITRAIQRFDVLGKLEYLETRYRFAKGKVENPAHSSTSDE